VDPEHKKRPAPETMPARERPRVWRSLDEWEPRKPSSSDPPGEFPYLAEPFSLNRRDFMRLMAASLALAGTAGCSRQPEEKILPYVIPPEQMTAGKPLYFATAMTIGGYATGVLAESIMGRPTKIEGNPSHPASLGGSDVFAQASVLDLWDPDRSKAVLQGGQISAWETFLTMLADRLRSLENLRGAGLCVLTETVCSPTLIAQLEALLAKFPEARWRQYQPISRDSAYEGSRLAFGEPVEAAYHFDRADVVLSLDADFLGWPAIGVRYARDFVGRRRAAADATAMNRLYAVESTPALTGAFADHRLSLRASEVEKAARSIAGKLGLPVGGGGVGTGADAWIDACVADLQKHRGHSLILAGDNQPPFVHALAHAMNLRLGNTGATVDYLEPAAGAVNQLQSLRELAVDIEAGRVDTLMILGGNPVYNAPADLRFAERLARVPLSVHLGLYDDETAAACHWHIPEAHYLETWGDTRAFDGTVALQQPLIAPLHAGRSAHELVSVLLGEIDRKPYAIVREYWQARAGAGFETFWQTALRDGVVQAAGARPKAVDLSADFLSLSPPALFQRPEETGLELMFAPDPTVWDGRFANNGWLQELPKPLTKLTWDNAALIAPALAARLGLANEDLVELTYRGRSIDAPVWIMPGHPDGAVTVQLGYGRSRAGRIGSGIGYNAYALRTADAPWFGVGLEIKKNGGRHPLAATQHHHGMEGRDIVRAVSAAEYALNPGRFHDEAPAATLYPPFRYDGYAWGMTIDLGACIGCNACTIACQAENNIPIVGKAEVARGREMHWIRVDRYYRGAPENPLSFFQPVPCMHCEHAPCEPVCPVEATVHDSEGLNVQVYNRCIGTRFCSNNCPYKVRRFNFLQYADEHTESLKAQRNPEVTVRMRGVMEKCSYCTQRITAARIEAEKEDRRIRDGEVVTACQAACPTEAIMFGDLNDPDSRVRKLKASPLNYALLAELNTRPRTTYLAKLTNPNPDMRAAGPKEEKEE
jgi:Fe-S-cluster-containing dehydrogenase component